MPATVPNPSDGKILFSLSVIAKLIWYRVILWRWHAWLLGAWKQTAFMAGGKKLVMGRTHHAVTGTGAISSNVTWLMNMMTTMNSIFTWCWYTDECDRMSQRWTDEHSPWSQHIIQRWKSHSVVAEKPKDKIVHKLYTSWYPVDGPSETC